MNIRPGDIFKIKYEHITQTWCRHNIVIAREQHDGTIMLVDTYWGSGRSEFGGVYTHADLEGKADFIGNLDEYRIAHDREFDQYSQEDRFYIPQGGGGEMRLVKKAATPSKDLVKQQLASEIDSLKHRIEWDKRTLAEKEAELAAI